MSDLLEYLDSTGLAWGRERSPALRNKPATATEALRDFVAPWRPLNVRYYLARKQTPADIYLPSPRDMAAWADGEIDGQGARLIPDEDALNRLSQALSDLYDTSLAISEDAWTLRSLSGRRLVWLEISIQHGTPDVVLCVDGPDTDLTMARTPAEAEALLRELGLLRATEAP